MARKKKASPSPVENTSVLASVEQGGLRLEWRSPQELAENPSNWRRHPATQLAALSDAISEVGWAGACLYNERSGLLIDGLTSR